MGKKITKIIIGLAALGSIAFATVLYINIQDFQEFSEKPNKQPVAANQPAIPDQPPAQTLEETPKSNINQTSWSNQPQPTAMTPSNPSIEKPPVELKDYRIAEMDRFYEEVKEMRHAQRALKKEIRSEGVSKEERRAIREQQRRQIQELKESYGITPEEEKAYQMQRIKKMREKHKQWVLQNNGENK